MKRSASAALAAVTALSLAVAPAYAQDDANGPKEDHSGGFYEVWDSWVFGD